MSVRKLVVAELNMAINGKSRPSKGFFVGPYLGLVGLKIGLVGPIRELRYYTVELTLSMKIKVDSLNE